MEDSAATAALVGVVLALVEVVKKLTGKGANGVGDYKQKVLEDKIDQMQESIDTLKTAFYGFREEARIRWAKDDADDK
jgi:hypothetical protein